MLIFAREDEAHRAGRQRDEDGGSLTIPRAIQANPSDQGLQERNDRRFAMIYSRQNAQKAQNRNAFLVPQYGKVAHFREDSPGPSFSGKKSKSGEFLSREWEKRFQVDSPDHDSPDFPPALSIRDSPSSILALVAAGRAGPSEPFCGKSMEVPVQELLTRQAAFFPVKPSQTQSNHLFYFDRTMNRHTVRLPASSNQAAWLRGSTGLQRFSSRMCTTDFTEATDRKLFIREIREIRGSFAGCGFASLRIGQVRSICFCRTVLAELFLQNRLTQGGRGVSSVSL